MTTMLCQVDNMQKGFIFISYSLGNTIRYTNDKKDYNYDVKNMEHMEGAHCT